MSKYFRWFYPDIPPKEILPYLEKDNKIAVVGIIGKSADIEGNKLGSFQLPQHSPFACRAPKEGDIEFYYNADEPILLVQFYTAFDKCLIRESQCLESNLQNYDNKRLFSFITSEDDLLSKPSRPETTKPADFLEYHNEATKRFANLLQLALQMCHIVVYVEISYQFDSTLLKTLRALKCVRDRHLSKLLPKLLEGTAAANLGPQSRLCSPRFLFVFENFPNNLDKRKDVVKELEFEIEDKIYKQVCEAGICNSNNNNSMISIHGNKQFVFFNIDNNLGVDLVERAFDVFCELSKLTENVNRNVEGEIDSNPGFPSKETFTEIDTIEAYNNSLFDSPESTTVEFVTNHKFMELLHSHISDVLLENGFYDFFGSSNINHHFQMLPAPIWFEAFAEMYRVLIDFASTSAMKMTDKDYLAYSDYFDATLAGDFMFLKACCKQGYDKALAAYKQYVPPLYDDIKHEKSLEAALQVYQGLARGAHATFFREKLEQHCVNYWKNGRQICGILSLRGNPCIRARDAPHDNTSHSSGEIFISSCNCGHIQGSREDPYTIQQANFDFYEFMVQGCQYCQKSKRIKFDTFQPKIPSIPNLVISRSQTSLNDKSPNNEDILEQPDFSNFSQPANTPFSNELTSDLNNLRIIGNTKARSVTCTAASEDTSNSSSNDMDQENSQTDISETTGLEYAIGLVHSESPDNVLPLFPSWSLLNVGSSCLYGHNTGLQEHFQRGFFSGLNYFMPWNVKVNLGQQGNLGSNYSRKRQPRLTVLKVFIGMEYECTRGRRFILNDPNKIVKGAPDINHDIAKNIIENDMPLYFPCLCNLSTPCIAQLMRVHIVTPKAPINISINPKVCCGTNSQNKFFEFSMGLKEPTLLSGGSYWVLRLPYAYQADEINIKPPKTLNAKKVHQFGYLESGIFGIVDSETAGP